MEACFNVGIFLILPPGLYRCGESKSLDELGNLILQLFLQRLAERSSELTGTNLRACSIRLLPGRKNPNCVIILIRYRAIFLALRNYGRAIWICEPFYQQILAIVANGWRYKPFIAANNNSIYKLKVGDRGLEINTE